MKPNGGTGPAPPLGQPMRDLFDRQVDAARAGIAQRQLAIRRWDRDRMGEDVKDEERLLGLAEKRLRRLLLQRQKVFAILARESPDGPRKVQRPGA
jgi:hypothetical protein